MSRDDPGCGGFVQRLDALLAEHWPQACGRIAGRRDSNGLESSGAIPLAELLAEGGLDRVLRPFAAVYAGQDTRAVASLWAQWYLAMTWPPLCAAAAVFEAAPSLDPSEVALTVDGDGRPAGLRVRSAARPASPATILETLVRRQAAPLIDVLASTAGVSPRVPWSNAASVLAWTANELSVRFDPVRAGPMRRLLHARFWPDGAENPLFRPAARPQRRICCLRYRLAGFDYCADCPVPRGTVTAAAPAT